MYICGVHGKRMNVVRKMFSTGMAGCMTIMKSPIRVPGGEVGLYIYFITDLTVFRSISHGFKSRLAFLVGHA